MSRSSFQYRLLAGIVVTALVAIACSAQQPVVQVTTEGITPVNTEPAAPSVDTPVPATETPVPIVHVLVPGEPLAGTESRITDTDTSDVASQRRARAGESFDSNRFERPFNAGSMDTYFQDLDIKEALLKRDSTWVFVIINLVGERTGGGLLGEYGVELDLNEDGRGDWLVMSSAPKATWSTDGVVVWQDANHDVGNAYPVRADPPQGGDGYETEVFDQGVGADPDAAWARLSPSSPNSVQIAFKRALIKDDGRFLWGAWAMDQSLFNPAWFDYNDHFTQDEAGSPLVELTKYYPLKAMNEMDNTCRWSVGFTPTGSEPGVCPVPPTPTPIVPGKIFGTVFTEVNGDLVLDAGSTRIPGANVRVRAGGCGSPGAVVTNGTTNGSGYYIVTVDPGTYCVDVSPDASSYSSKTPPQTVVVPNGTTIGPVDLGYSQYLG